MKITCIVPSTLDKDIYVYLSKCIASLQENSNFVISIVLVTNSTHFRDNLKVLKHVSEIYYVASNAGFSDLNNFGIELALSKYSADYILLLNDDAFLGEQFFSILKNIISTNSPELIIPKIFNATGAQIDSFGVEYFRSGYAKNNTHQNNQTKLATGCCLVISSEFAQKMLQTYGYIFNPLLYFYLEDVEFSIRAQMLEPIVIKTNELTVYHHGSATSGKKSYFTMYQTYRNILWVMLMTWPKVYFLRHILSILLVQIWVFIFSTTSFGVQMYLRILLETIANFKQILYFRKKNLHGYKRKNFSYIFSKLTFRTYHNLQIKVS